jgi:1,4-alpha-glucan branching enzyme
MPEKATKKDRPVPKAIETSATSKKEEAIEPLKAKSRSRASKKQMPVEKAQESTHSSKLISFSLEASQAGRVFLAGCFNGWNPRATPLKRDREGMWTCAISIEPGEHQYRFVVDGEWQDDPLNLRRCWNEFGTENCLLVVED